MYSFIFVLYMKRGKDGEHFERRLMLRSWFISWFLIITFYGEQTMPFMVVCYFLGITIDSCISNSFFFADQGILRKFQNQIAIIQRDAVWWLHSVVPMMITGKLTDYAHW